MKTLVLAPFSADGLANLEHLGSVVYEPWTQTQRIYEPEELGERLAEERFEALVVEADFLFEELFREGLGLRFAALCRADLNQVDLEAATERGVVVVHTPGRNAQAVAELVLGLMVGLARHIPQAASYVNTRHWEDPTEPYRIFRGLELAGKTLGILGLGEIGKRVARLGRGIGMRVVASDPYVRTGSRGTAGVVLTTLETVLRESDFVTVHVPETLQTMGLLNASRLRLMRPTAYLVNVASPAVVDPVALAAALWDGGLAGAAMDVHETHPILPTSPLLGLSNVVLTPHIGGATAESVGRHSAMVAGDMERFVAGARPKHLANPSVWKRRVTPR